MGLSNEECSLETTMECLSNNGVNIDYANVFRWDMDKTGGITADIFKYGTKENRNNNPDEHLPAIGIGFTLPPEVRKEIWDKIGTILYPYIEYHINCQKLIADKVPDLELELLKLHEKLGTITG